MRFDVLVTATRSQKNGGREMKAVIETEHWANAAAWVFAKKRGAGCIIFLPRKFQSSCHSSFNLHLQQNVVIVLGVRQPGWRDPPSLRYGATSPALCSLKYWENGRGERAEG